MKRVKFIPKTFLFLKPLALGIAAVVITFIIMMGTSPFTTSTPTAILYFFLSIWIGRVWPPQIHIWYFLIPPFVSLPAAYLSMFSGSRFVTGNTSNSNSSGRHSNVECKHRLSKR